MEKRKAKRIELITAVIIRWLLFWKTNSARQQRLVNNNMGALCYVLVAAAVVAFQVTTTTEYEDFG